SGSYFLLARTELTNIAGNEFHCGASWLPAVRSQVVIQDQRTCSKHWLRLSSYSAGNCRPGSLLIRRIIMPSRKYFWLKPTLSLLSLCLVLLTSSVALAQETRSTILGTVKDSAGAVVAGAVVEIHNSETNATVKLTTNDKGFFEAPYLVPGTYNIAV